MAEMRLIYGRRSKYYDHFSEYDLGSCRAVAARLMGVTALKLTWLGKTDRRSRLFQIIHLDYSEYGIDEYREFECVPGMEDYAENKQEMNDLWNHFIAVMGSEVISIDAPCMLRLIESAMVLADEGREREYDNDENREFRAYAASRLKLMTDALNSAGITSADCSVRDAIETVSPLRLSALETINYFLMRLVDRDFDAAATLTTMDRSELPGIELVRSGVQSLVRCDISRSSRRTDPPSNGASYPFRCRITTLARDSYYHATFVIWLSGNYRSHNPLVTEIRMGSVIRLTDYEAALQISRPEYITVFDCKDEMLKGFDSRHIGLLANSEQSAVPNGWLYTAYKKNNAHVDSSSYRMDDDVIGYALLSIAGELVLMSPDLHNISALDDATVFSLYSPFISAKGRFRLDTSVFRVLCQSPGAMFEELVEPGEE